MIVDNSDNDDEASLSPDDNRTQKDEKQKKAAFEILQATDRRKVFYLRALTIGILASAAITLCIFINRYLSNNELEEFENAYHEQAEKVLETVQARLRERILAIDYFGLNIVSHSISMNVQWPKLYVPHVEVRINRTNAIASTLSLSVLPIVTTESRSEWQMFAKMMQRWHAEGLAFQEHWADPSWEQPEDWQQQVGAINSNITKLNADGSLSVQDGPGPFLPKWQSGPSLWDSSVINLDLRTDPAFTKILDAGLESGRPIFGESFEPFLSQQPTDKYKIFQMYMDQWQSIGVDRPDGPVVDLVYPLHDDFFGEPNLVGLLHSYVSWDSYLVDILPAGDGPLEVSIENSCDQAFQFEIRGPEATYLKSGRHQHDGMHSDTMATFESFLDVFRVAPEDRVNGECLYEMHVFATEEMKERFHTRNPLLFTATIAAVFVFTSLVFLLYDWTVKRNQAKIMSKALQTGEIVSSLFPEAVRDRLIQEKGKQESAQHTFINEDPAAMAVRPVADLYPACTVGFADLVGFTKWSSTRTPKDVFTLLETIYGQFDRIAHRRKVFKVETIGDCYLAVTGLPQAQPTHALIMSRFAFDCMRKLQDILGQLSDQLGADTATLTVRFGLHSGEVTAGVLRGEKARFQLFGDTVNTASRMESTGQPGRIQVSEQTARELERLGKKHWLTEREDKVQAKGKGDLTTYWLVDAAPASSRKTSDTRSLSDDECFSVIDEELENSRHAHSELSKIYDQFRIP